MSYWQGKKIKLRAVEMKDAEVFFEWGNDEEICRNMYVIHFPQSLEQVKQWLETLKNKNSDDSFRWMAEDVDGNTVGTIDTFSCNRRCGTFKYGITLSRSYWGKGFAKEMIIMVLRYYFLEMDYQKVTPHVYTYNQRSIRLHESLGFKREGQLRNMLYSDGRYFDEIHFGMTKAEFVELHGD